MPKIAQYQGDQVRTQVVNQPLAQGAPAGAFGGDIIKGAVDVVQAGLDLKKRVDTTAAEEALVQFERDKNDLFFNPDNGYFNTQGRNAYDAAPDMAKALEELKRKYGESLGADARSMFDGVADKHITSAQVDVSRHASKGLKAWEIGTIEAQVENSIESASLYWNDPEKLRVQNVLGEQAVLDSANMMGLGPEETAERLQTFRSTAAEATITAAIRSSSAEGRAALEKYGDRLETGTGKMEDAIAKREKVEETQTNANLAVLKATRLVDQYDSRADIIAEVNTIEDPDLRKKTMTEAMSQLSRKQQAEKETQNGYYQSAIADVNKGMTPNEIMARNPEAWEGMTDTQRNNILSGKHMITDQLLFSQLRSLPVKDKAKLNPVEYADSLRPSDLQKLTTEVNAAKKGDPGSRVKSLTSKAMQAAEGAFGKRAKWMSTGGKMNARGEKANQFLTDIQDAIDEFEDEHQRRITPAEEDKLIGDFTRGIVVERSRFGIDILAADLEIDLSNTPPKDLAVMNRIIDTTSDVDVADLTAAYQYLIDNDQPVTVNALKTVYSQGTK